MPVITIPDEDLYYYYHNWQAHQDNKIHKGNCGFCNHGLGMHANQIRGENGVWIGPFSTLNLAIAYVQDRLNLEPGTHACCE